MLGGNDLRFRIFRIRNFNKNSKIFTICAELHQQTQRVIGDSFRAPEINSQIPLNHGTVIRSCRSVRTSRHQERKLLLRKLSWKQSRTCRQRDDWELGEQGELRVSKHSEQHPSIGRPNHPAEQVTNTAKPPRRDKNFCKLLLALLRKPNRNHSRRRRSFRWVMNFSAISSQKSLFLLLTHRVKLLSFSHHLSSWIWLS